MSRLALGEAARFVNGAAFKPSDWGAEGLPIIRIQNLTGTADQFNYTTRRVRPELVVEPGDLLVSWSATLDVYRWSGPRGLLNQHIFKVFPKADVEANYLFFALKSVLAELSSKTHGSTMKHVVRGDFESTQIAVPSLAEQRRIADLLSRAEGIVRLRREAQRKAAELIPTIFVEIFGDPATNPKRWPLTRLGDLVKRFEGGKNIQSGDDDASEYRILKISAVTTGRYIENESKPVPADFEPAPSYFVRAGDLLFSRANTEALVGATAMVESTNGKTLLPDKLWRLVWGAGAPVTSHFMLHLLQQPSTRAMLSRIASGTGGSMKNISQAKLKELRLPLPPLELQHAFDAKVAAAQGMAKLQVTALAKAQAAFDALLHRAFAVD